MIHVTLDFKGCPTTIWYCMVYWYSIYSIPGSLVLYGTKSKKPLGGSKGIKGANAQLQLAHEVWLQ